MSTTAPGEQRSFVPLVALLLGGLMVAFLLFQRRSQGGGATPASGATDGDGPATPSAEAASTGGGEATNGAGAAVDATDDAEAPEPSPEQPFAGVDVEMLSDEERVLRLLEANGGRMKQARIVKETDWSNAKVSQLLSSMAEDDEIDKLRIGRENLISLPSVDVDSFES